MVGKVIHWGCIEVVSGVTWENWEIGKEYTRLINVKNIGPRAKKIKFRIPSTRFFGTLYPKPILLSPGTTFQLPVTFKPVEQVRYQDGIEFYSKEDNCSFGINLFGELPKHVLHCPEALNINICAVGESVSLPFEVTNKSNMRTLFTWLTDQPFTITPQSGFIEGSATLKCQLSFEPKEARTYCMEAILTYGETIPDDSATSLRALCKLSGVGKFPHLVVRHEGTTLAKDDKIEFGQTPYGKRVQRIFQVANMSPAGTRFRIRRRHPHIRNVDKAFKLSLKEGFLPAFGFVEVEASFEPTCPGIRFEDHFAVEPTCLASRACFTLTGSCGSPIVTLQPSVIEFGCFLLGASSSVIRTFTITNHSPLSEAVYEVLCDNTVSVFKFSSTSGNLKPGESRQISLCFCPSCPINFYRRVTVLVSHQDPLMMDLLGTAYSIDSRPPALKAEHLDRYRVVADRGLARYFPEQLYAWLSEGKIKVDSKGALEPVDTTVLPGYSPPAISCSSISPVEEYFDDGYHSAVVPSSPYVSFDREWIHMATSNNTLTKPQTIHLTNHTRGKIIAQFAIALENEKSTCHFVIEPMKQEVPAGRSASFTVKLSETTLATFASSGTFLSATIECYCFHSVQRDHTLVQQEFVMPPWCLLLNMTASTYPPVVERGIPVALSFNPIDGIYFPSLVIGETAYRSMVLSNKLDLPALISIEKPSDECFEVKPRTFVVRPGAHMLATVRFRPTDSQMLQLPLRINVNEAPKNTREVTLVGSAEPPEIVFDDGDLVFIAPTCINAESHLPYTVRNVSRQRVEFQWLIPIQYRDIISIRPTIGCLDIRSAQTCTFVFSPKSAGRTIMRIRLTARVIPSTIVNPESIPTRDYFVRLVAVGCEGNIVARQPVQNYGALRVGRSQRMPDFIVTNDSDCSVRVRLMYQHSIEPLEEDEQLYEVNSNGNLLIMDPEEFTINPHCDQHVTIHVRPKQRCRYSFRIGYQLLDAYGDPLPPTDVSPAPERPLATLIADAIFPQLYISDVQASGSARLVTKRHLWQLLSLDDLNVCLSSDPHDAELGKSRQSFLRHSARRRLETSEPDDSAEDVVNFRPRSFIQWDLGAMPFGTDPWKVHLTVENTGPLDADWQFLFPTDLLVDIQPWAENLDFDEEELHEMMVVDNKLFDISPRRGTLQANGGQQMITITFKHQYIGTSRLPVLMKIADGREVLITLTGTSVADDTPYLYLPKTRFCLAPVAIGDPSPPVQPLELFNGGRLPVEFKFDLTAIQALTEKSFGHQIFTCLTPGGNIAPGRVLEAQFKFSPLEARTYSVDVPLRVEHGEMHMLTVVGLGYDRRLLGDSAPDFPEPGLANPPAVQAIELPNQPARLSVDRLQLGNVPLFVRVSRAVLLHNLRLDSDLAYEWKVTDEKFVKMIDVEPSTGVLKPGHTNVCQVTFTATPPAAFHEVVLVCLLSPQADIAEYHRKLEAWEAEREAQLVNLGLDNGRRTATPRNEMVELTPQKALEVALQPRFGRLCEVVKTAAILQGQPEPRLDPRGSAPETSFHTITIPPLLHGEHEALDVAERYLDRATAAGKLYPKPFPPPQTVLQLAVTARTHDPGEFTQAFGVEARKRFVADLTLVKKQQPIKAGSEPEQNEKGKIICRESEIAVIADTIGYLLMKTLKEADMRDVFKAAVNESIPNYVEMLGVPTGEVSVPMTPSTPSTGKKKQAEAPETAVILDGYLSSILCSLVDDAVARRFDITHRPRLKAIASPAPATAPKLLTPKEAPPNSKEALSN